MTRASRVHVIAIAGPSGSGKTSLARELARHRGGVVFGLDAYYRDQRDVNEGVINVDDPAALDHERIVSDLTALAAGRAIQQPIYDYATHSRAPEERTVEPAECIIVEGLYALYWAPVRALIDTAIFVSLDHETCLRRRVERDARERGRTPDAVAEHYQRSVRPMYDLHIDPTRRHARLLLDGSRSFDDLLAELLRSLPG